MCRPGESADVFHQPEPERGGARAETKCEAGRSVVDYLVEDEVSFAPSGAVSEVLLADVASVMQLVHQAG